MKCSECAYWGDGDGTGWPYDAGHMNQCKHPKIDGNQHPSYGACGEPTTMLCSNQDKKQFITTRASFGCVLFKKSLTLKHDRY